MNDMKSKHADTFELAETTQRFFALLIDTLLFGFIAGIFGINGDWFGGGILGFIAGTAYQWYFLTHHNGQTPGKMLLGLQVIKTDGTEIADIDAVMRTLGYTINTFALLLGWIWVLVDSERQGWHDKLARTYVIKKASNPARNTVSINH